MSDIDTIDPDIEPEYIGVHSMVTAPTCQHWQGDSPESVTRCGAEATHTTVMFDGKKLMEMASCDECGDPDEAASDREWSGRGPAYAE